MRSHHIVAFAVVLVVGVSVKMFFFTPRDANLETPSNAYMTVLRLQNDINLLR